MPQIADTETDGTAAVTAKKALSPHPPLDVRADMSTKPQTTRLRLVEMTAAAAQDLVNISPSDGAPQGLLLPVTQAALEMIKIGGAVVGFWFEHATAQLAHNSQAVEKLAGARNWQDALKIQNSFLCDGFSRLNDGMSRYAGEAGTIVARSRQTRAGA